MKTRIGRLSYEFLSEDDSELSCVKNEKVVILEDGDDKWSYCHRFLDPNAQGYVPTAYLEIKENEKPPSDIVYENFDDSSPCKSVSASCLGKTISSSDSSTALFFNKEQSENMIRIFRKYVFFLRLRRYYRMSRKFKKQRNRLLQILETISTEETYVRQLTFCLEEVKKPLLEQGLITTEQSRTLFSNMKEIQCLNQMLLRDLHEMRMPRLKISTCFIRISPFFKMYRVYCNNFQISSELLEKIKRKDSRIVEFDESLKGKPGSNQLCMIDFFLIPILRIPRYKLLLRLILKNTDENHEEYEELKRAFRQVSSVDEECGSWRRRRWYMPPGRKDLVIELAKVLRKAVPEFDLIQAYRKFIDLAKVKLKKSTTKENESSVSVNSKTTFSSFKCYLFSDLIVFLKNAIKAPRVGIVFLLPTEMTKMENDKIILKTTVEEKEEGSGTEINSTFVEYYYVQFSTLFERDKWQSLVKKYIEQCVDMDRSRFGRKKAPVRHRKDEESEKDLKERVEYLVLKHLIDDEDEINFEVKCVLRIKIGSLRTLYCFKFFLV